MTTPKVFEPGNRKPMHAPSAFRLEGDELEVSGVGSKKISYEDALAAVSRFQGRLRRSQDVDQDRDSR